MLAADIRSHVSKKKAATDAGPSRPSKKSRVDTPSVPTRESDIPSETVPELVLVSSTPTMLLPTEALSAKTGMVRDEGAAAKLSVAPSVGFRVGSEVAAEPE